MQTEVFDNPKYQGNVKIELMRGEKVYKTISQHNEGTTELFKYLANALAGNLNNSSVPKYVHTFYNPNLYDQFGSIDPNIKGNSLYGNEDGCRSTCATNIPYGNLKVVFNKDLNDGDGGYETVFTFMIPFAQIWGQTNVLAIYNTPSFGNNVTPIAYIKLTKEQSENWDLGDGNTSNIKLTWTMAIIN